MEAFLPSTLKHCGACSFEGPPEQPDTSAQQEESAETDEITNQQHLNQRASAQARAVSILVSDRSARLVVQDRLENLDDDAPEAVLSRPALACAETILRGECELLMARKSGEIVPKLSIVRE